MSSINQKLPTFRQLKSYLESLGFNHRSKMHEGKKLHLFEDSQSDDKFIFRSYPLDEPLPNHTLQSAHHHLVWWGWIDDIPYEHFLETFSPAKAG